MARPIKETPVLTGEDARRFEEHMKNLKPVSKEFRESLEKSYEILKKIPTPFQF
ncbi:hypothetical protein Barb4_02534 [Bacteroidales bacterium Barb4]|nr:hypothetical protein Barb4_02534 [Bacteroidales bacterium Barb4]